MDYRFHPHARSELDDALSYYLKINPELARDFVSEVESAIGRIMQFPEAWTSVAYNTTLPDETLSIRDSV